MKWFLIGLVLAALIGLAIFVGLSFASGGAAETEGRDAGPRLLAGRVGRQDLQAVRLQGQAGGRRGLVPQGLHRG